MKRVIALAVLMALAVVARIDLAGADGSCGGGAHGGGGGGGGMGGGGEGWSTSAPTPACDDASDVVGFHRCRPFGAWATRRDAVRLVFEGGLTMRQFDTLLANQVGSVSHGSEAFQFRAGTVSRGRPRETAMLATFRGALGLVHGLYGGIEVNVGGLVRRPDTTTEMSAGVFGSPELAPRSSMIVDSLAIAGVRGALGPSTIGVELAGGIRAVSYRFQSSYHDCVQITSITAAAAIVEARARGELWLSPWFSAGATLGTSLIERGAWMGGLYVAIHTRAFDDPR